MFFFFFFKQKTAYEIGVRLVGSEMCIRDSPKTIRAQELAASAVKLLDTFHCNQLLVVDEDNRLIGALHLHDLMGAKVL